MPGNRRRSNSVNVRVLTVLLITAFLAASLVFFAGKAYVVPVLMYHSIDYEAGKTKLSVTPESFARQMKFFHDRKYNVVGLDKVILYLKKKEPVPPKTAAITFDDGYYNNYKYAYPVLRKYALPATIFVIVDKIGSPGYLGWKEIEEMSASGIITIGSHTLHHLWLPDLDEKSRRQEISLSRDVLEKRLGKEVKFLCYPIGAFDDKVEREVEEAGYAAAVATNPRRFRQSDDIYAIKRIKISRTSDNLIVFWIETSGYYTWIKEHRDE